MRSMGLLLFGILKNGTSKIIGVSALLALLLILSNPVCADTPTLKVQGNDLAPRMIYLGDAYAQSLNDIVMLQLTFETTSEEAISISSITVHRGGQSSDSDVKSISLYEDGNYNSELESENDTLLSSAEFTLGRAELAVGRSVNATGSLQVLVVIDISSVANSGGTLGIFIPDSDYVQTDEPSIIEFELPISSKNSTIELDTDGDLNPDSTDPDDDNDRYMDDMEISAKSDPKDENSLPLDTDSDFVPDIIDTDDDNDGVPDKYDDFPKDKNQQRDYTIVIIYAVIAVLLIIFILFIARSKKPAMGGVNSREYPDEEGEFDLKSHDIPEDMEEKVLDEEDDELLNED
jgi:hypothetical protein